VKEERVSATYRLLTVEHAHRTGFGLQLEPKVKLKYIGQSQPGEPVPFDGDEVELRLPDGTVRSAYIAVFAIEAWLDRGVYVTRSDPKDPSLTLTLAGDLTPGDAPVGTEVWRLAHRRPTTPTQP
jgi:hypothetical protein